MTSGFQWPVMLLCEISEAVCTRRSCLSFVKAFAPAKGPKILRAPVLGTRVDSYH